MNLEHPAHGEVKVEQRHRDAAADAYAALINAGDDVDDFEFAIRTGRADDHRYVQAFASLTTPPATDLIQRLDQARSDALAAGEAPHIPYDLLVEVIAALRSPSATDVALLQHENECLLNQVKQKDYPCSPHCEGYLRELRLRNSAPTPPDQPQIGQFPDGAEKLRRLDDFMVEEIMADHSEQPWRADDFKGDNEHLICCIDALLDLEDAKCLVPSGLGGRGSHAYRLLCAARHRLSAPPIRDIERVEQAIAEVNGRFPDWSPTPAMRGYARAVARAAIAAMPKGDAEDMPDDVRRLVIAARNCVYNMTEELLEAEMVELDQATEAFAARVPWEDQPDVAAALRARRAK